MLYLVGEITLLLVLASLLGGFVGYLRWGRRSQPIDDSMARQAQAQAQLAQLVVLEKKQLEAADEAAARDSELKTSLDALAQQEAERVALASDLEQLRLRSGELNAELDHQRELLALRDDKIAATEQQLASAAQHVEARTIELKSAVAKISEVEADRDAQAATAAHLDARLRALMAELDETQGRLDAREAQLAQSKEQLAAAPPPLPTDDLELINGIGPATSNLLKRVGLGDFKSLATADNEAFEAVNGPILRFKARMAREDWAGQARQLHRVKYGADGEHDDSRADTKGRPRRRASRK